MAGVVSALKPTFTILPSRFASHLWVRTNGNGSPRTSTPTKIKEYADEILLTSVGEDMILPPKTNRQRTQSVCRRQTIHSTNRRGRRPDDPQKITANRNHAVCRNLRRTASPKPPCAMSCRLRYALPQENPFHLRISPQRCSPDNPSS